MKLNLIIDGNFLFYKNIYTLSKFEKNLLELKQLMNNNMDNLLSIYSFDKVYFCSDSKKSSSWRKDVYPEYKAHREYDEKINWDYAFGVYDEFKLELSMKGIHVYEFDKCEGDDIILFLTMSENHKGNSNFIVASDSDLRQLLKYDISEKKSINIIYNDIYNNTKVYLPVNYKYFMYKIKDTEEKKFDIFNFDNAYFNNDFYKFLSDLSTKYNTEEVDSIENTFIKIVKGDKTSDNVPSIHETTVKTDSSKTRGIGESGAKALYDKYIKKYDDVNLKNEETFIENLTELVKESYDVFDDNKLKSNIKRNMNLIVLDSKYIPKEVGKQIVNRIREENN